MEEKKKFKSGKFCGFRKDNQCNSYCGLFNIGLGGCVLHSINMNLQTISNSLKGEKE